MEVRESDLKAREQEIKNRETQLNQQEAGLASSQHTLAQVRIESPIDGIVTRRNIEEGENVMVGTMNNAGTVLLTIADMSVIEAEIEVDETDIPFVQLGPEGEDHDRRPPRPDLHGHGDRDRQQPDPDRRHGRPRATATNFKVVVTLDDQIPDVRPGFTCTAEITTATRQKVLSVPIQATDRPRAAVRRAGQRRARAAPAEAGFQFGPAASDATPPVRRNSSRARSGRRSRACS